MQFAYYKVSDILKYLYIYDIYIYLSIYNIFQLWSCREHPDRKHHCLVWQLLCAG